MTKYNVTGMTCAACQAHVEKAVCAVDGVENCAVSLLTNSMQVEGTASNADIIKAVENAGYGASVYGQNPDNTSDEADSLKDTETPKIRKRLIWSIVFLIPLMYISMGHMMWGWPAPEFLAKSHINMGLYQLLLTTIIMIINKKFFVSGFKGLIHKAPNMDTLVALGSSASYAYSTVILFIAGYYIENGMADTVMSLAHNLYFESAAMILTLITLGKMLEAYSKGRTTDALKSLMKLSPNTALVERDGVQIEVPVKDVKKGDIFIVKPGENIPVDGIVIDGSSAVNEAAVTGESIPVDKTVGSEVTSATSNISGYLKCRAERVGEDTTLAQIIRLVSDASSSKAPIAKIADKVSGIFVPAVITVAAITFIIWLLLGESIGFSISRAISVLVISCPCALGLATPVAIMVGNGKGAKSGILFKTAEALENTGKADVVVLDKTGTITQGKPEVTDIFAAENVSEDELISIAYALESKSEHPLAEAINNYAKSKNITQINSEDFKALPGNGLSAVIEGRECFGGNAGFISENAIITQDIKETAEKLAEGGKTPLFFAADGKLLGIIAVADVIKSGSKKAIEQLKGMGIRVIMLTGDNERTAHAIAASVGTDDVIAGVMPDKKEAVVAELKKSGYKVAMVGDGINDAPALTRADTGMAIGAGSDIAIDSADVVLMKSDLLDVPAAIRLSRRTLRNIHQNLFWAFAYNTICIPVAIGALVPLGITLNPMIGAAAMSLSSFCVVSNALRLNFVNVYDSSKDKSIKTAALPNIQEKIKTDKEETKMIKTIKIEGMMCVNCENHVRKALSGIDGVEVKSVSHEKDEAVVELSKDVSDATLKETVEEEGYKVISVS